MPAEDVEDTVDLVRLGDDGADEGSAAAASADAQVEVERPSQEGLPIDSSVEVAAVEAVPMGKRQHVRGDALGASAHERGRRERWSGEREGRAPIGARVRVACGRLLRGRALLATRARGGAASVLGGVVCVSLRARSVSSLPGRGCHRGLRDDARSPGVAGPEDAVQAEQGEAWGRDDGGDTGEEFDGRHDALGGLGAGDHLHAVADEAVTALADAAEGEGRTREPYEKQFRLRRGVAERLLAYAWPGNVRELQNCIERAIALARFEELTVEDLPPKVWDYKSSFVVVATEDPTDLVTMEEVERRYVQRVMEAVGQNKTQAAKVLGFDRTTLYRKLERYKLGERTSGSAGSASAEAD